MKIIRFGEYAKFRNSDFELLTAENNLCSLVYRGSINPELKEFGFEKYAENVYLLELECNYIDSAFYVSTFCLYKGYKFFIEIFMENGLYRILPADSDTNIQFDFHPYADVRFEVEEEELKEIWEERKPIEGFTFDTEPIVYLKKKE
jgi:hypothetical protein